MYFKNDQMPTKDQASKFHQKAESFFEKIVNTTKKGIKTYRFKRYIFT